MESATVQLDETSLHEGDTHRGVPGQCMRDGPYWCEYS